eukprot:TRINITY_DN8881_c0_g1_i1.p1 TRINITY_DN8881_c0_g1~~TRINITY_DN8881_c0_g1_i1.p1  ORF type:complete len:190 (-),score=32.03 TRINITY_DN8881_c0_g1_i1:321-863(-)
MSLVSFVRRSAVRFCPFSSSTLHFRCSSALSRYIHSSPIVRSEHKPASNAETVGVSFIDSSGKKKAVRAPIGDTILTVAHANKVELEGACEGSCACSTCHVVLPSHFYDKLPEPTDEENDMLDLAFGLTETSRLGCQVKITKDMEGMEIQLPAGTRNVQAETLNKTSGKSTTKVKSDKSA